MRDAKFAICLLIVALFFYFRAFKLFQVNSADLVYPVPQPNQYRSDEFVFLRTFYLIRDGKNYYQAFNDAVKNDVRGGYLTKDVFAWREPTIFYFWGIFARSGIDIAIFFIVLSMATLVSFGLILNRFLPSVVAIVSPVILVPYFWDPFVYQTGFLFTEWWGLFFFIFGLTAFFYRQKKLSFLFFSLSVMTRELFLFPLIFMLAISLFLKKNRLLFGAVLGTCGLFFAMHYFIVQSQPVFGVTRNPFSRLHFFSFSQFQREVAFSMRQYPLLQFRLPFVFVFLTFFSTLYLIFKSFYLRLNLENWLYIAASLSLTGILPFSGVIFNDYWGIVFMPLVIGFSPLSFLVFRDIVFGIFPNFRLRLNMNGLANRPVKNQKN